MLGSVDRTTTTDPVEGYRRAMNDVPFRWEEAGLVVVDLQNSSCDATCGFVPAYQAIGHGAAIKTYRQRIDDVVIPNVQKLQTRFRAVGAPVVFLTVGTIVGDYSDMPQRFRRAEAYWKSQGVASPYARFGSREMQVMDAIAPALGEAVIPKSGYSGFTGTPLQRVLFNLGVRQLAICGVATEACVESTLRDGVDRGFDAVLVEDACASVTSELHRVGVRSMELFARIMRTDELLAEGSHVEPILGMATDG